MALKIFDKFAPRANPADSNYPYGSIKNESVPGAKDGTPLDAAWGNDMLGFTDALLADVGITPSGAADTALVSQRLDAVKTVSSLQAAILLIEQWGYTYKGTFAKGFTYSQVGDAGVDSDFNVWIYVGAGAPNKVVAAGTVPSVGAGYERVTFNAASGVISSDGKNLQYHVDDINGFTEALLGEAGITPSGSADTALVSQRLIASHAIFDNYGTVADLASGKFKLGKIVMVTDRDNEPFKVISGVANGFDAIDAGFGNVAELQNKYSSSFFAYGAKNDLTFDSSSALNRMIAVTGGVRGPRAALAIGQSLNAGEGFFIKMTDNVDANVGGAITTHSSVGDPTNFDFITSSGVQLEHIHFENVRFLGGRHVINQNNSTSGYLSQFNAINCIFQEISGYVVNSTNSFFVTDFEKCRLIRAGGFNCGFGTNLVTLRNCGAELMARELFKQDTAGSSLPSASLSISNCRIEGLDADKNAFPLIDIAGEGKTFNFLMDGVNYIENTFLELIRANGCDVTTKNLFVTNSTGDTSRINVLNGSIKMESTKSLVPLTLSLDNSRFIDSGGNGNSLNIIVGQSSQQLAKVVTKKKSIVSQKDLIRFSTTSTSLSGSTVYAACSGVLTLSFCGSKSSDGTLLYGVKTYLCTVRKFFGENDLALSITETGSNAVLSDVTINLTSTAITTTTLHLAAHVAVGSGTLSDFVATCEFSPLSNSEGLDGIAAFEL